MSVELTQRVFMSYSRADEALAGRLVVDLQANGVDVWQDVRSLVVGDSITREIEGALANCTAVVILLSEHSARSSWVEREYRAALSLQGADPSAQPKILPCLLDGSEVPLFLREILYADFRGSYDSGVSAVARGLGIEQAAIPTVRLQSDVAELADLAVRHLRDLMTGEMHRVIPSHDLFAVWSPIEDRLLALTALESSLGRGKWLEKARWELLPREKHNGELDQEAYPRGLFLNLVANILRDLARLAERQGVHVDGLSADVQATYESIGGQPASN